MREREAKNESLLEGLERGVWFRLGGGERVRMKFSRD